MITEKPEPVRPVRIQDKNQPPGTTPLICYDKQYTRRL